MKALIVAAGASHSLALPCLSNHLVHANCPVVQILSQPRMGPVMRGNALLACSGVVHIVPLLELTASFHLTHHIAL